MTVNRLVRSRCATVCGRRYWGCLRRGNSRRRRRSKWWGQPRSAMTCRFHRCRGTCFNWEYSIGQLDTIKKGILTHGCPFRYSVKRWSLGGPAEHTQQSQKNDRANEGDQNTGNINAGYITADAERIEYETTDQTAENTDDNISQQTLRAVGSHHDAGEPACDSTYDNPD